MNGRFQSLWRLAIVLCAILAIFVVILVSCTKPPEGSELPAPAAPAQDVEPAPEATPVPTPEPTEAPSEEFAETEAPEEPADNADGTVTDDDPESLG